MRKREGSLYTRESMEPGEKNKPLITVVTVVFNGEKDIENTILSVLNQTFEQEIEYIIIDGGSTDTTVNVIKKYESKIDYWVSEKDKGIYDAMNKGIMLARGEWINFMNCGDAFYANDVIAKVFAKDLSRKEIVYGSVAMIYKYDKTYLIKPKETESGDPMTFCHQAAFARTELAKRWLFDLSYPIYADRHFFFLAKQANCSFYEVDDIISRIDLTSTNASRHKIKDIYERNRLYVTFGVRTKWKGIWMVGKELMYLVFNLIFLGLIKIVKLLISKRQLKKLRFWNMNRTLCKENILS